MTEELNYIVGSTEETFGRPYLNLNLWPPGFKSGTLTTQSCCLLFTWYRLTINWNPNFSYPSSFLRYKFRSKLVGVSGILQFETLGYHLQQNTYPVISILWWYKWLQFCSYCSFLFCSKTNLKWYYDQIFTPQFLGVSHRVPWKKKTLFTVFKYLH